MKFLSAVKIVFENRHAYDHFRNRPTQMFVILMDRQRPASAAFGKSGASV